MTRVGLAVVVVVVALVGIASPASAHAQLVSTNPANGAHVAPAPSQVSLRFSENVSLKLGGVRVLDTDGERVDKDDAKATGDTVTVSLRDGLGNGPYVVAWNVVSADSHPVNGAFTFVVGAGAGASEDEVASLLAVPSDKGWRVLAGIGRFASYAGILLAAGSVVFSTFVDRRRPTRQVVQIVTVAGIVGAVGLLVQIPLQAAIATETGWRALRSPSRWIDVLSNSGAALEHDPRGRRRRDGGAVRAIGRGADRPRGRRHRVRGLRADGPYAGDEPRVVGDPRRRGARGRCRCLVRRPGLPGVGVDAAAP